MHACLPAVCGTLIKITQIDCKYYQHPLAVFTLQFQKLEQLFHSLWKYINNNDNNNNSNSRARTESQSILGPHNYQLNCILRLYASIDTSGDTYALQMQIQLRIVHFVASLLLFASVAALESWACTTSTHVPHTASTIQHNIHSEQTRRAQLQLHSIYKEEKPETDWLAMGTSRVIFGPTNSKWT